MTNNTNDTFITVGVGVSADDAEQKLEKDIIPSLVQALQKAGLELPVGVDAKDIKTLQQVNDIIQSIGGSVTAVKDNATNTIKNVTVMFENLDSQLVRVQQSMKEVKDFDVNTGQVTGTHMEETSLTSSVSGQKQAYDALKEAQQDLITLAKQRQDIEVQLYNAVLSEDTKQIASLAEKRQKNEALMSTYKEQYQLLLQQEDPLKSSQEILNQVASTADSIKDSVGNMVGGSFVVDDNEAIVQYATNIKDITAAIKEYNAAVAAQVKSSKSDSSEEWQKIAQRVTEAEQKVQSYSTILNNVGITLQKQGNTITATYSGSTAAMKQFVTQTNQAATATEKLNAAAKDKQSDTELINQTVEAYKKYTAQILKLQKLDLSGQRNTQEYEEEKEVLDKLKQSYQELESKETSYGITVGNTTEYCRDKNQATRDLIQAQKELNATMDSNSLQSQIADMIEAKVSLDSLQEALTQVKDTVLELNEAMTNIQMVTQESTSTIKGYMEQYAELGQQIGVTTADIASGAEEWFRQGANQEEALELTKASAVLQTTGSMEASAAVESLTSAINGYQLSMEDAMSIVDKIVTLDVDLAVSSEGVATALSRVASAASQSGIEMDKMMSILAVTIDQTQGSAETVGRAWNSIIQRMTKISAGKDLEDSEQSLNDVMTVLNKLGISLTDEEGIIRDVGEVLDEVAAKWDTWNRNEQSQISTALAGQKS